MSMVMFVIGCVAVMVGTAMVAFGLGYANAVRQDHALFVDAFRELQGPLGDMFRE